MDQVRHEIKHVGDEMRRELASVRDEMEQLWHRLARHEQEQQKQQRAVREYAHNRPAQPSLQLSTAPGVNADLV